MSCLKSTHTMAWILGIGLMAGIPTSAAARDGDPDRSFGTLGSAVLTFPGGLFIDEAFPDVKLLPNGKLLVSASVDTGTSAAIDMGVMRLNPDGSIDTSFGIAGASIIGFNRAGSDNTDFVLGMAVQSDGRILLVGDAAGGTGGIDMAVVRLNANGSLDTSFGTGGKTTVAFDLGATAARRADQAVEIAVQADGGILIGGTAATAAGGVMAIARLTSGGTLDTSFDGDGKRTLDFGSGLADVSIAYGVLPSSDGLHSYVVGAATLAGNQDYGIARLLNDGSPDTSFAGDGTFTFGFDIGGTLSDAATQIIELPGGKLLACGATLIALPSNGDFSCMRVLANGTVDSNFLPTLIPFDLNSQASDEAYAATVDTHERIVLAGRASAGSVFSFDIAVARLLPSGQVDPSFGIDGRMTYDGPIQDGRNFGFALAMQPDGKIVVAGSVASEINGASVASLQLVRLIGDTLFENGFEDENGR